MAKHSEHVLAGLLGLSDQSARKSHYPELLLQLEEVERERNRYKWLFEHATYGIFQSHIGGGFSAVNPALAHMLGYASAQEFLAVSGAEAFTLFVDGVEEVKKIRAELLDKTIVRGYETRLFCKDGKALDVLMNILLKDDEPGVLEGFVADISERKKSQHRLQRLNQELEQRVDKRTSELQLSNQSLQEEISRREQIEVALREARDAAQEANRSKDKYLAAASHDLLQPLNAARLLMSTLRERELPPTEKHLLERAHMALEGAEDLLADLLDIARLDQAAITPSFAVCRIDELFNSLASEFEPVALDAGLQLKVFSSALCALTDNHLLMRILRNFLSNACRYTESGRILLGVRRRGANLRLEVWDTGMGVAKEQQEKIFLEFNQLSNNHSNGRKGVGLGLAIVERIASILDARVELSSQVGRGSCFSIEVPLASAPVERMRTNTPRATLANTLCGQRVLVVDNEPDILHSMDALLTQWECDTVLSSDYNSSIAALQGHAPDLIIVDLHLDNNVTGLQVVEQLRAYFSETLPAVLITADYTDQEQELRKRLGIPMLNKPVRPGKLRAVMSHQLKVSDLSV
ncbi:MAG: NahK/ErcS family hybrid sensor histidine kinase/response regulator [Desulfuromonas sp.]|nr:NahK/ErcS family hybrid sensor histidine kinase/response regulator [Desulfuromonas sp.]